MKFKKTINSRPYNWLLHHIYVESLEKNVKYISGMVVDIGCGLKPYKNIVAGNCQAYFGIEHSKSMHSLSEVDVIGSALHLPFKDMSADTVLSFQVMEHIPEPELFLREVFRILKYDRYCILTTPFMWGEHEIPYDFYRYTQYGLEYLSKKAGFQVVSITADTGFWTTTIIRLNYFLMGYVGSVLKYLIYPFVWSNQYIAYLMDKIFNKEKTDTANYTIVLKKNETDLKKKNKF